MAAAQPSIAQLRPALQLALDVARDRSPRALPGRARALVGARRLPGNWTVVMAQLLADDDAFREVVADAGAEADLGRVPWLWLRRPDGWEAELDGLLESAAANEAAEKASRLAAERTAALEAEVLASAERASRLEADKAALAASAEAHRSQLGAATGRLRRAEQETAARAAELEAARAQVMGLRAELEARDGEIERLHDRLAEGEAERQRLLTEVAAAHAERDAAEADRAAEARARQAGADRAADIRAAVAAAGRAAAALGQALGDAAVALGSGGTSGGGSGSPAPAGTVPPPSRPVGGSSPHARGSHRPARPSRRRPIRLPPAVFDDSTEAAAHLVRADGAVVVVDGYNVTFTSWSGRDLPALRHRLVAALSELAVRLKRPVTVVFDGTDEGGRVPAPAVARPWLRIVFSASSVEADQVIVQAVEDLASDVPVIVATNDRQVRRDVAGLGANVVSVEQLLAVLGRLPDPGR